jgi:hypothetical protein
MVSCAIWSVPLFLLLDRLDCWVDPQLVLNHLPRDPKHVRYFTGDNIDIVLEDGDKLEFLFGVQVFPYLDCNTPNVK